MTVPLAHLPVTELARRLRARELSSEELVRDCLQRIEQQNSRLQAFVELHPKRALRAAREADKLRRKRTDLPPFLGIPIGIKDLNFVRGMRTRFGSQSFTWLWSPIDDVTTAQLRRAGFIILGKLATSELGALPITEVDLHPPTRNPHQPEHTAGGSSGGSGAAVAADLLPVAQGSDGGGSIRIPAAFCGLVGHKPSRGRVPDPFMLPDQRLIYTMGALTRNVDDAATMLDVMAGVTVGRPHWAPRPSQPFAEVARRPLRKGARIRFAVRHPLGPTHPEIEAATLSALKQLEAMGHHIEEMPMPDLGVDDFLPIWRHVISLLPLTNWRKVQPVTRWLGEAGRQMTWADAARHQHRLEAIAREWREDADFVVTPTVSVPAPKIGAYAHHDPETVFRAAAPLGAFTVPFNITGQPALSLPMGKTTAGLPMGLQIAGRDFADGPVLALARQLEETLSVTKPSAAEAGYTLSAPVRMR
jgi:amidase